MSKKSYSANTWEVTDINARFLSFFRIFVLFFFPFSFFGFLKSMEVMLNVPVVDIVVVQGGSDKN